MSVTDAKTPMYEARTGICTTDFPKYGAYELFARAAGYGYTVVQFGFQTVDETSFDADGRIEFPDFDSLSPGTISIIERAAMRSGVEVGAVNGTFNAAHPDAEVRRGRAAIFGACVSISGAGLQNHHALQRHAQ